MTSLPAGWRTLKLADGRTAIWSDRTGRHLPVGGGDIHCMHNPTDRAAVSVHVYGGNSAKLGPNVVKVYQEATTATA